MPNLKAPQIQDSADFLQVIAPGATVTGDLVEVGFFHGIAQNDAAQGQPVMLSLEGTVRKAKDTGTGTGWTQGGKVYFSAGKLTGVAGSNKIVGVGAVAAADGDTTGVVVLGYPAQ